MPTKLIDSLSAFVIYNGEGFYFDKQNLNYNLYLFLYN